MIGVVLAGLTAAAPAAWLERPAEADVCVAVHADATPGERFAAEEFSRLWTLCTGRPTLDGGQAQQADANVWIGPEGLPADAGIDAAGLGNDGLHYKSAAAAGDAPGRHLFIAGDRPRGTLYGVYQFFHDVMGVRWLTPGFTHVPPPPAAIAPLDFRYVPPIPYRDTNYWMFVRNPGFAAAHRLNGNSQSALDEAHGSFIGYTGGFGHTLFDLVNPDLYFDAHPEYFSLVGGVRTRMGQLCLTNPEVVRIATDGVRTLLRGSPPNRRIVSVTQMDRDGWCTCDACAAADAREDSHAGTMIAFVNAIAEAIAPEFPDAFIDTFAYTYTRRPPKHLKARDNVLVRLCSIECDFSRPLGDASSRANRAFQEDVIAWRAIAKHLWIWDYTQNWHAFQGPHPNLHVLQPNALFFARHGAGGLFEQAAHSPRSDFDDLKAYLVANALWNPSVDWKALYREFVDLYYGPAAPHIDAYLSSIRGKVERDGYRLHIFSKMEWMDAAMVREAETIFARAFEAAGGGAALRERVSWAYLPVQYAALTCPPEVERDGDALILRRPPSLSFDAYWALIGAYGVSHIGDPDIEEFRKRLDGKTPPREQRVPLVRLANAACEMWAVPEFGGAIVRLRDAAEGVEWLGGFRAVARGGGAYQEWSLMNPVERVKEAPIAPRYAIAAQSPGAATLDTALPDGLLLSRTMRLDGSSGPLHVSVTVRNPADRAIAPWVKLHPEFHMPKDGNPELWIERGGAWSRAQLEWHPEFGVAMGRIEREGVTRWALARGGAANVLVNAFGGDAAGLAYFFSPDDAHFNLEIEASSAPLEPGAARTVEASYAFLAPPWGPAATASPR